MDDKMMGDDMDVENVGIMQGFLDSMDEGEEDDEEYGGDDYATVDRRPDSPEILMNNLRGDMRSIDARRDELADLVGYAAAAETPEAVLAMLQPVLAAQGPAGAAGAGIGGLPPSAAMAQGPQPPMAPPPMPPGAPGAPGAEMAPPPADGGIAALLAGAGGAPAPGGQPPIGMAHGGYVQNFARGSGPGAVTPTNDEVSLNFPGMGTEQGYLTPVSAQEDAPAAASDGAALYSPEMLATAERLSRELLNRPTATVPSLGSLVEQRAPEYRKILGDTTASSQAQLLFELGQRAFNFAGNVDDAGRPLRGGMLSRLAQASRSLPGAIGRHVSEIDKGQRQIKLLAMQAAEKDIDQINAANQALTKEQRALVGEVLKGDAKARAAAAKALGTSIFGKGDWEWSIVNQPNLLARWSSGLTNATEDGLIQSAITKLEQPTFYEEVDPNNPSQRRQVTRPGILPPFVKQFRNYRAEFEKTGKPNAALLSSAPTEVSPGSPLAEDVPATSVSAGAPGVPGEPKPFLSPGGKETTPGGGATPPPAPAIKPISLWRDRHLITGPVSAALATISAVPGLGDPMKEITKARADAELYAERLINAMLKSTQGSVKEQERLKNVMQVRPSTFRDPDNYGTKLISLGDDLRTMIKENLALHKDQSAKNEDRLTAYRKAQELQKIYDQLDLPPVVYTVEDARKLFKMGYPELLWEGLEPIQQRTGPLVTRKGR